MAGIPLSALRRALASLSGNRAVDSALAAPIPGAMAGAAFGAGSAALDGDVSDAEMGRNGLIGAGIGAGLGALGAGSVISRKLREALAEAAAERGMGRAAMREVEHADDAMRFHGSTEAAKLREGLKASFPEDAQAIDAMSDDEIMEAAERMGAPGQPKPWLE